MIELFSSNSVERKIPKNNMKRYADGRTLPVLFSVHVCIEQHTLEVINQAEEDLLSSVLSGLSVNAVLTFFSFVCK